MKKSMLVLLLGGSLIGGGYLINTETVKAAPPKDEYVRIADLELRDNILNMLYQTDSWPATEAENKEAISLFEEYGIMKDIYAPLVTKFGGELNTKRTTSYEGAQKLVNLKEICIEGGRVVDMRPLSNLTEVESIEIDNGISFPNLNIFSKLTKVKNFHLTLYATNKEQFIEDTSNGNSALTDITALNNMPNLERISLSTRGEMQPIVLKKGMTQYRMVSPIQLSTQFDGAKIVYNGPDKIEDEDIFIWNDLVAPSGEGDDYDEGTEELYFDWRITKGNYSFDGKLTIPIIWKNIESKKY